MGIQCSLHISSAMVFADLTRHFDVNYFTGFKNRDVFSWWFSKSFLSFKVLFTTWVRLLSFELRSFINQPHRNIIRRNLPSMFRKYYPNCCVIINCPELFIETPSSLDEAAACWFCKL